MDVIEMSEERYLTGKCPMCGEALQVPERLKEFSCMFCGEKLTPSQLTADRPEDRPEGDPEALLQRVRESIIHTVADDPVIRQKINRKDFDAAFDEYERSFRGIFDDLDLACRIQPDRRDANLEDIVSSFLDRLEERWTEKGRRPGSIQYNMRRDDDKMTIAVFLVPMVGRLRLSISKAFGDTLQRRWVERHPKSPFYVGTYEAISEGFRRKFKFCFITTAVCREAGKPDDCPELTAFRAFRDGYLANCPDGPALIAEYYEFAPGIVTALDLCGGPEAYREVRETWLDPCYRDILADRPAQCNKRYTDMVRTLATRYLS